MMERQLSLSDIVNDGLQALRELSKTERAFHIFWLLGPLIMLIERSPADIWITALSLAFLVRACCQKQSDWLSVFWVRAAFAFWFACLFSSALSSDPLYSLGEAFVWMRFPIFAIATAFWLGKDKRLLYLMFLTTLAGLIIMCLILSAELLIEGQKNGRLLWPYDDLVPGNYLAKVGLPVFVVLVALAVSEKGKIAVGSGALALISMIISVMAGERINFLIRACSGMLAAIAWQPNWRRVVILICSAIFSISLVFVTQPDVGNRFVSNFIDQLPTGEHSGYFRVLKPAIAAFESSPLTGIGTGNLRNMCPVFVTPENMRDCHPHPHNYYVQLAGETGFLGLTTGVIFIFSIIWSCLRVSIKNRQNVIVATSWIIPFGLFWPITSTADFFGQWNNIFVWSAVALSLSAVNIIKSDSGHNTP
ncbi:O-antigen ligase family protein [Alphaproteobacteria bacterium]|nr:O-antigen ligase family protein [Alphaproteobacteria bacterium]